jgi:hypothetical protein
MSLQITLDGQSEAIVRAQLAQGHVRSAEDQAVFSRSLSKDTPPYGL